MLVGAALVAARPAVSEIRAATRAAPTSKHRGILNPWMKVFLNCVQFVRIQVGK